MQSGRKEGLDEYHELITYDREAPPTFHPSGHANHFSPLVMQTSRYPTSGITYYREALTLRPVAQFAITLAPFN